MYIHTGEWLGQPQVPGVTSDYIKWVQRSLNLQGEFCQVDGRDSPAYREAVKRFKKKVGLPENGQVDKDTQDALILSNQRNSSYVDWVQTALNHPKTIKLDPALIRQFQEAARVLDPTIRVDGVVGPKTEAAIVRIAFKKPLVFECV
jgi:peptidoglycan hydrolase-like protein with peptidoglycan-binding domain